MLVAAGLAGCRPPASPTTAPALVEPAEFATWPRVTERPVRVNSTLFMRCSLPPPPRGSVAHDAATSAADPHAEHSIVVRVSPDAVAAYREGRPLPAGAVVVKEKYNDASASGPLRAYGMMIKRGAGFDSRGGDWEYAYVALAGERSKARGRLAGCAGCHASAHGSDYLFRSYGGAGR
ncbi:MAG: cytochrome P460 family protein [Longimicrobiaceae bacterium]